MSVGFTLAMPVGSQWAGYNHKAGASIGTLRVVSHRPTGIELYFDILNKKGTVAYPLNTHWKLDGDHIRIAGEDGKLLLTFAPA